MSILLAKIKGINSEFLKVMSSRAHIFDMPDLSNHQEYSPEYKLEYNEWYKIAEFSKKNYKNGLIETNFNSTDYNKIDKNQYSNIIYLCCKQGNYFIFQKILPTQFITNKWFHISDAPTIEKNKPIIILHDFADAVYDITNDVLYFKEIARIKPMFKGIDELYREATQAEVDEFLNYDFLSLGGEFTSKKVKTANRKRIARAMDTFKKYSENERQHIFEYTKSYCKSVPSNNDTFIVENEEHLKLILFGIEQRYYTTTLGNEKRLANSVMTLEE